MSLQVKNKVTPNNSNRNVVLTETTGVYSGTNPGGYGYSQSPTGYRNTANVASSNLELLNYNGTVDFSGGSTSTIVDGIYSTSYIDTTAQAIAAGTSQTIDLGSLIPEVYVDSVYKSYYYNWFTGLANVSYGSTSPTSSTIVVTNIEEFVNASYIDIFYSGQNKIYEIVSVDVDALTVVINGEISSLLFSTVYKIGYSSISYFASTYYINKCLHSRISKLAISSCSCNNRCTEKLYEAVMLYMAIQPNMDLGKYQKAQDIITYLTNYCNDGCCNC